MAQRPGLRNALCVAEPTFFIHCLNFRAQNAILRAMTNSESETDPLDAALTRFDSALERVEKMIARLRSKADAALDALDEARAREAALVEAAEEASMALDGAIRDLRAAAISVEAAEDDDVDEEEA
jgi:chromosome segregation ATPase